MNILSTLSTLFSFLTYREVRSLRAQLQPPPPMPESELCERYIAGGVQGPPPQPEVFRCKCTEEEWSRRINSEPNALNEYMAEKAMRLMTEASPVTIRRMARSAAEAREAYEQEEVEAAIRALELKFNGPES